MYDEIGEVKLENQVTWFDNKVRDNCVASC